jgi:protein-L-isoaspartate(D-aspartate) O-methyltransferase
MRPVSRLLPVLLLVTCGFAPQSCAADDGAKSPAVPVEPTVLLRADVPTTTTAPLVPAAFPSDPVDDARRGRMVETQIERRGVMEPAVLEAMRRVPRHLFVPDALRALAYDDRPLPIGENQTISQPYIVGCMTEFLEPKPGDRILEIGTGSGYQAAILAEIAREVVSIEIVGALARQAAERLESLGYRNITVVHGDGYQGWPERAPYQGIMVTAVAETIPQPLLDQLAPGGRLVIPSGRAGYDQELLLIEKADDGTLSRRAILPVRFVPLTREVR